MGATKRLIEEMEEKRQVAIGIAVQVGLLTKCELHDDEVYDPLENNHVDAYKLANRLITNKASQVSVFEGNRTELTDLLSTITNDFGEHCPICESWKKD